MHLDLKDCMVFAHLLLQNKSKYPGNLLEYEAPNHQQLIHDSFYKSYADYLFMKRS
jgi:hypothetical protein